MKKNKNIEVINSKLLMLKKLPNPCIKAVKSLEFILNQLKKSVALNSHFLMEIKDNPQSKRLDLEIKTHDLYIVSSFYGCNDNKLSVSNNENVLLSEISFKDDEDLTKKLINYMKE